MIARTFTNKMSTDGAMVWTKTWLGKSRMVTRSEELDDIGGVSREEQSLVEENR